MEHEPERPSVAHGRLVTFPSNLTEGERRQAAANWTQAFYARLESHVRQHPSDWEGTRFLHRWRVMPEGSPSPAPPELNRIAAELLNSLKAGQVLRVDTRRVAPLQHEEGAVLCDVQSLRSYRFGVGWSSVAQRVASSAGLNYRDVTDASKNERGVAAVMGMLAKLHSAGALTIASA